MTDKKNNNISPKVSGKPASGSRRKSAPRKEEELYSLPKSTIKEFIAKERRHDELDRLREVRKQKRTWNRIFMACVFMNLVFIAFAVLGGFVVGK